MTGVAIGTTIKLAGIYENDKAAWEFAGLLNHELGHVLTLRHSWMGEDGCDDTPHHENCWSGTDEHPCSNNLMDYNAHQAAVTPCQIKRMHLCLASPGSSQSKLAISQRREDRGSNEFRIKHDEWWFLPRMLDNNVLIEDGASLYISTWVSLPENGYIKVKNGGKLVLSGATLYQRENKKWSGILKQKKGIILADKHSQMLGIGRDFPRF